MSDETLHDSAPKATKALLGTIAFILIMVGIEQLADRDGPRYFIGGSLIVGGVMCSYAAVMWTVVRERLPDSTKQKVSGIALSPYWWLATALVAIFAATLSPYIEDRRWPFSSWFPASPTLDQTANAVADKLAGRLIVPKPEDYANAITHRLPSPLSADDVAEAVVRKMPKQPLAQTPSVPSADEIARAVVHQLPVPDAIEDQTQQIHKLSNDLTVAIKNRDELTSELNSLKNSSPPKSKLLGLDDAKRWQLFNEIRDASVDKQGNRLNCQAIASIDPQGKLAIDLLSEIEDLISKAWNIPNMQGAGTPPHQPFGLTFVVGTHSGNAFTCASRIVGVLQNSLQIPVSIKIDQVSDNLVGCNNECVEIRYGGER